MKAQIKKELIEIIMVSILIVIFVYLIAAMLAAPEQGTGESFRMLANEMRGFIDNKDLFEVTGALVSAPIPYFVEQKYFLVICREDTICICENDDKVCATVEPLSSKQFEGYTFSLHGNSKEEGKQVITGDGGIWDPSHRRLENIYFTKLDKDAKHIEIFDCSKKKYRKNDGCKGTGTPLATTGEDTDATDEATVGTTGTPTADTLGPTDTTAGTDTPDSDSADTRDDSDSTDASTD